MSEQRPMLLPFRLRRRDARRGPGPLCRPDDTPADAELRELLRAWTAPEPAGDARARLLESFRAHTTPPPLWRRLLAARVSVPLPAAACAAAALVASAAALAALWSKSPWSMPAVAGVPAVRLVEVPVPQERVVTRFVYVEREPRRPGARPAPPDAAPTAPAKDEADAGDTTSYFTGLDMAEFRPADEMKIRVIKKGRGDEEQERKVR